MRGWTRLGIGALVIAGLHCGAADAVQAQPQNATTGDAVAPAPKDEACRSGLAALGVTFEDHPPIHDGACGAAWPLEVSAVAGIALTPAPVMVCPLAEALARWTRDVLLVKARERFDEAPTRIATGPGYVCKQQGRVPGARLSEHARANAIDVGGFFFEKRDAVNVGREDPSSDDKAFLAEIRAAACEHFTTVLGPGSDAAHETHLHFDLRPRKGDYRICQ